MKNEMILIKVVDAKFDSKAIIKHSNKNNMARALRKRGLIHVRKFAVQD